MRDLKKSITEYQTRFHGKHFRCSDYDQVLDMSTDLWEVMYNSFSAAFMIGYRYAKREMKKKS